MKIPEHIKKIAEKLSDALVVQVEGEDGEKRLLMADEFISATPKPPLVKLFCSVSSDDVCAYCEFCEWIETIKSNKEES
ncbi:MAG: hypothetical protein II996_00715 [Oscillospiraceae bacterium]|nr:hypothetical protein [Oscillospiraceae bacterium]